MNTLLLSAALGLPAMYVPAAQHLERALIQYSGIPAHLKSVEKTIRNSAPTFAKMTVLGYTGYRIIHRKQLLTNFQINNKTRIGIVGEKSFGSISISFGY